MTKSEVINKLKKYFSLQELVCDHVFNVWGDKSWMFLDNEILETLLILREDIIKKPIIVNNWNNPNRTGKRFAERGYRCNLSEESSKATKSSKLYASAHCNGCAIDFNAIGMDSETVRQLIIKNQTKLPYPIRMEEGVSWVHIDMFDRGNYQQKITLFKA